MAKIWGKGFYYIVHAYTHSLTHTHSHSYSMCVVCMEVCMYVATFVCACAQEYLCMWRPNVNAGTLTWLFSTLFFQVESLNWNKISDTAHLHGQFAPDSPFSLWRLQVDEQAPLLFAQILGTWNSVFSRVWQLLWPFNLLSGPKIYFDKSTHWWVL